MPAHEKLRCVQRQVLSWLVHRCSHQCGKLQWVLRYYQSLAASVAVASILTDVQDLTRALKTPLLMQVGSVLINLGTVYCKCTARIRQVEVGSEMVSCVTQLFAAECHEAGSQ